MANQTVDVVLVEDQAEQEEIFALRYEIYVREMGKSPPEADHRKGWIRDDLDPTARLYGLKSASGEIVGTVRINLLKEINEIDFTEEDQACEVNVAKILDERLVDVEAGTWVVSGYDLEGDGTFSFKEQSCSTAAVLKFIDSDVLFVARNKSLSNIADEACLAAETDWFCSCFSYSYDGSTQTWVEFAAGDPPADPDGQGATEHPGGRRDANVGRVRTRESGGDAGGSAGSSSLVPSTIASIVGLTNSSLTAI